MAFFEERFDERLSFGARGGPVWSTTRVRTIGGKRLANRNWIAPLHRYSVGHAIKDIDDFEIVRAFFYVVYGAYDGFRFKDWSDYEATQDNTALTLITGNTWQLQRRYAIGAREYLRDITKPRSGVVVYDADGDALSADVDTTTGIATVTGTPASWAGEFDVPVAFESDAMEAEIVDRGADGYLMSWPSIVLEEIPV